MKLPKYRLFDYSKEGPGVDKDAPKKTGIALFWDILLRRFWKMVSLNFIYLLFSLPALIVQYFMLYSFLTLLLSQEMINNSELASYVSYLSAFGSVFAVSLFGSGSASSGMSFVLGNYVADSHAWVWADFFRIFKACFLKGTVIYIADAVMLALIGINFWFYGSLAPTSFVAHLLQGLMVVVFLVFLLMHSYVYQILAFYKDKKVFEIYKNAFILSMGKLPQSASAIVLAALFSGIICYLGCSVAIYFALIIPIVLFAFASYINIFITNPTMIKYLGETCD